jgi:hypothetical protein
MNKRNVQSFLMVSAAFFAMNLPVRPTSAATPASLAAAVSHTARVVGAGIGQEASREASQDEEAFAARR